MPPCVIVRRSSCYDIRLTKNINVSSKHEKTIVVGFNAHFVSNIALPTLGEGRPVMI